MSNKISSRYFENCFSKLQCRWCLTFHVVYIVDGRKFETVTVAPIIFYNIENTCLEVIKTVSCSTELSTKFIILINVKMPTIVGILTFISMINTTS